MKKQIIGILLCLLPLIGCEKEEELKQDLPNFIVENVSDYNATFWEGPADSLVAMTGYFIKPNQIDTIQKNPGRYIWQYIYWDSTGWGHGNYGTVKLFYNSNFHVTIY